VHSAPRGRLAPLATRWHVWVAIGLAIAVAAPASADRVLLKYEDLQALVPDGTGWCSAQPTVTLRGQSAADFTDTARLQKLLGGLRAALSFECPQAQQVNLVGRVGDADVYKASAAAANGWALVAEGPSAPPEPAVDATPAVAPTPPEPEQTAPSSSAAPTVAAPTVAASTNVTAQSASGAPTQGATETLDTFTTPPASSGTGDAATTFEVPATAAGATAPATMPRVWLLAGIAVGAVAIAIAAFFLLRSRKRASGSPGPQAPLTLDQAIAQQRASNPRQP